MTWVEEILNRWTVFENQKEKIDQAIAMADDIQKEYYDT